MDICNNLMVYGDATIKGTLNTSGNNNITGNMEISGNFGLNGNMDMSGIMTIKNSSDDISYNFMVDQNGKRKYLWKKKPLLIRQFLR